MARLPIDMEINAVVTQIRIDHAAETRLTDQYREALARGAVMPGTTRDQYAAAQGRTQRGGILPMLAKAGGMESLFTTLLPAISSLTGVIGMAVSNSKIVATIMNTVGKALGLLVDLILMPFLPITMWALIRLFQGVMFLGKVWNDFVKGAGAVLIASLVALKDAIVGGIGLLVGFAVMAGGVIWDFLLWLWNSIAKAGDLFVHLQFEAAGKVFDFLKWLWDALLLGGQLSFKIALDWISDKVRGIVDFINALIKLGKDGLDIIVNIIPKQVSSAVSTAGDWWTGATTGAGNLWGLLGPSTPPSATGQLGGSVEKTGFAYIHKGETVIPEGRGGITVNIYGTYQNDEDLYKKFIDRLRRDQWRYNA